MKRTFTTGLLLLAAAATLSAQNKLMKVYPGPDDWPWWRGPTRDSKAALTQKPPIKWSTTENVLWKTSVPGRGHSSPSIWDNRLFINSAEDKTETQYTLCYDVDTGKQLWKTAVHKGSLVKIHKKNSHASGTPAIDGLLVFTAFANRNSVWASALDFEGKKIWHKNLGKFKSVHGYVGSPAIYKSLVIINFDSVAGPYVVALHRQSGEEAWRTKRSKTHHSFSSPALGKCSGRDQLVFIGPKMVESYNPADGSLWWSCAGPSDVGASTATFSDTMVFASGGYPKRALLAIKGDGKGDVTGSHIAWKVTKKTPYATSMLLHKGLLYSVHDNDGKLRVFHSTTGKEVYQHSLPAPCSSSPVLANGNIYIADEKGTVTVFKAGTHYEELAQNDMKEGIFALPAFARNRIYIRTHSTLYCIGKK